MDSRDRYEAFLESKRVSMKPSGFSPDHLNESLFEFQVDIVRWACMKGRAAIFADCGLGKTIMQLEWAHQVVTHSGADAKVLILAPLAVSAQTCAEGERFGISVTKCRSMDDVTNGINITNYEMLSHFDPAAFVGIVLDESSILKSYSSKTRNAIIDAFKETPYKLACTATPSPNDYMELGNHSEFVGAMDRTEMLAMFFIHDGGDTQKWRLKGHASSAFWDFVASWAVMVRNPSDMGYQMDGFDLPELEQRVHVLESDASDSDSLFVHVAQGISEQRKAQRKSIEQRVQAAAELVNSDSESWIVWCTLNDESAQLAKAIPDAVEVKGSDSPEHKEDAMLGFASGRYRVIVTKPSICGFGMNWQHCARMVFVGLSNSYEQYYQAVRRCYRFGQKRDVEVHIVTTSAEIAVVHNVMRKKENSSEMEKEMISRASLVASDTESTAREASPYMTDTVTGGGYTLMLGDCVERIREIPDESVDFSIFSPPFASLYTYSNSDRDMGNCKSDEEFIEQLGFLANELYRVLTPGREVSFHCMNLPTSKERDGYIGIRDFRGDLIRVFEMAGFIYHSEVTIWKDPVTAMQRTKAIGLLNKQKNKDSTISRQGIPDYLVTMRKPGTNPKPVTHTNDDFPISEWQKIASPVWMDINMSRTLNRETARENNDERHICPLQLDVIDRALLLWSNPGDTVLSPFMGIGSEGYCSILRGREFIGIELKKSYFDCAKKNIAAAVEKRNETTIFDFFGGENAI